MDILFFTLGLLIIGAGILGAFLPIVPGPPLAWLGVLLIHVSSYGPYSSRFLWGSFAFMVLVTILDYVVPIWGTKKFGGTKNGTRGATLGLIIGLFFMPFGILLGPFLGAVAGELLHDGKDSKKALRSGFGALVGFLLGTFAKFIFAVAMLIYALRLLFL
jgi:uncharacterized protein YqgC (DUF456 family)